MTHAPTPERHAVQRPTRALRRGSRRAALWVALSSGVAGHAAPATDATALSLEQLLDVSVIGAATYEQKQGDVAASVSVITRQDIQAFGWRTLAEALASLPGVYTTYDRQYAYLGMRGFGLPGDQNTRTLITINGNRLNDPVFDQGPVGRDFPLDMDLIERIEFLPGPGGAVYGQNAMFGVVNVVTRTGGGLDGTELAASWQSPQSQLEGRATWGKRMDGGLDLLLSVSGMHARGQNLPFDYGTSGISGVAAGLDGERVKQLSVHAVDGAWSFDVTVGDRRKYDPTGAYLSDPLVPGQYQGDRLAVTQLAYEDRLAGDTLQLLARVFAGSEQYSNHFDFGTLYAQPATGDWRGYEVRLLSTALAGHKLMVGLEYQDNAKQYQYSLDFADPARNVGILDSGYRAGVYVQDEWRLATALTATVGVRMDQDDATGRKSSPRAALIWRAPSDTTVKALYGRAHRSPNAYERDYADGVTQVDNLSLASETIDTAELAVDHRLGPDLAVHASLYRWGLRDLIQQGIDPVSGLAQYQSQPTVRAQGLELSADKTWVGSARLRGSVSWQNVTESSGARPPNSPPLLAKLNLSSPLPWAGLRTGCEFQYDARRNTLDGAALGGYSVSNLTLNTQSLAPGLDVSLRLANLFDKAYAQPAAATNWQAALAQDGRSLRLQATYRY